jgi:protein-tyrosine phosphatase
MFRYLLLPKGISGTLFLHSMPGRRETLEQVFAQTKRNGVTRVVSLASFDEIRDKSHSYANAIDTGSLPCVLEVCEIPDYGIPNDRDNFVSAVNSTAYRLREGEHILLHCCAGIGRTGMFASCVLIALGATPQAAEKSVKSAGSAPVTSEQKELILWFAQSLPHRMDDA